jgi:hypothetical protein
VRPFLFFTLNKLFLKKNDVFASLDHAHCGRQRLVQLVVVVVVGLVQLVVVQLGHGSQRGMKETHTKRKIIFFSRHLFFASAALRDRCGAPGRLVCASVKSRPTTDFRTTRARRSTRNRQTEKKAKKMIFIFFSSFFLFFFSFLAQRFKAQEVEGEIKKQLAALFDLQQPVAAPRAVYQLRASRTATQGLAQLTNNTVVFDTPLARQIGPVLILAKNTTGDPRFDSFDGDLNGLLDVDEAFLAFNRSNVNVANVIAENSITTVIEGLNGFIGKLRSRATVNGGSIGLRALVVSGTTNAVGANPVFQKFDASRILITPCFPVTDEPNFNVRVYAGPVSNGGLATRFQTLLTSVEIPLAAFVDGNGAFRESTTTFELKRLSPGGPADTAAFAAAGVAGVSEGTFFFERW